MSPSKRPPLFIDLDETLVHASDGAVPPPFPHFDRPGRFCRIGEYHVQLRAETPEILALARGGGREVFLFTMSSFGFAAEVSQALDLGFGEHSIFSFAMILNCRSSLCPEGALIDDRPLADANTRMKADALGISADRVWRIPSFEPPSFASAKLFLAGLPLRLSRLDTGSLSHC